MTQRKHIKRQRRREREVRQRAWQGARARRRLLGIGVIAAAVVGAIAVAVVFGAVTRSGGGEDNLPGVLLAMGDNFFQPDALTIKAGQTYRIRIWNQGQVVHNVWMAGPDDQSATGDDIRSEDIAGGEFGSLKLRIDQPGTYNFVCTFHPGMGGQLIVESS